MRWSRPTRYCYTKPPPPIIIINFIVKRQHIKQKNNHTQNRTLINQRSTKQAQQLSACTAICLSSHPLAHPGQNRDEMCSALSHMSHIKSVTGQAITDASNWTQKITSNKKTSKTRLMLHSVPLHSFGILTKPNITNNDYQEISEWKSRLFKDRDCSLGSSRPWKRNITLENSPGQLGTGVVEPI